MLDLHLPDTSDDVFDTVVKAKNLAASKVIDAQLKVDENRLRTQVDLTAWASLKLEFEKLKASIPGHEPAPQ